MIGSAHSAPPAEPHPPLDAAAAAAHAADAEEAEIAEQLRREAEEEAQADMQARFQEKLAARAAEKMGAAMMIQQRFRGMREAREREQVAAAVRIQAVHRGRVSRRYGVPAQYTVDSAWGRRFLAGLGPTGVRSSRPVRHEEGAREYLRRLMLPRLGAAMRAAEAARPVDPSAFVAEELRDSSWALTGKEWAETASEADRYAAAERREADGRPSTDYVRTPSRPTMTDPPERSLTDCSCFQIAELRLLRGVDAAMGKVSKDRPERPWEVMADYVEDAERRRRRGAGGGSPMSFCSACGAKQKGGGGDACGSCGAQL